MKYELSTIYCRPWLLNSLSLKLIESHYENNYGGALRRLNAITAELESLDFANAGFHVGCKTAIALRDAGFDATYMKGGHSGWRAIGGATNPYA